MPRDWTLLLAAVLPLSLASCSRGAPGDSPLSAGPATVFDTTGNAFSLPAPPLTEASKKRFFVGNSFFNQNWVTAPSSVTSRDGLGPLFNTRSCSGCHFKDGRSKPPEAGKVLETVLLRVSIPGRGPHGEPLEDPTYGDQIQTASIEGVPAEADVLVEFEERTVELAGGEVARLRRPLYRLKNLGYGEPARELAMSARAAPAMVGLGLLEAVPQSALRGLSDPDDRDGDGISGRPNVVWDARTAGKTMGRFGWKAEQPNLRQQAAAALRGDMGLTTSLFPSENHTDRQAPCREQASGGTPEATDDVLRDIVAYARTLGVPARRGSGEPEVQRGQRLFDEAGCASCHRPVLEAGPVEGAPELGGGEIHPYTDLLLHDLGDDLGDGRPSFEAAGSEWRTAPLWGIGLVKTVNAHTFLLHDGRARDVREAVLWHGGEARASRDAFAALDPAGRHAMIRFVESL
jgi:CxxC motif-containing protein (DUF1111 family)